MLPVPSQSLPDHLQDPPKFSPRSVSRLDEEDEDEASWDRTLRPFVLDPASARRAAHSRDSSAEKISHPHPNLTSPRLHTTHSRGGLGAVAERLVDPKGVSYGHHRQTSIVHGIQHSRNASLASNSSNPLSPQMIAAAGAGLERPDYQPISGRLDGDGAYPSRPPTALSGSTAMERAPSGSDMSTHGGNPRKLERMHSKSRRDHPSHLSHSSRHYKDDQKTVGEYALHVLFTSVGINPCGKRNRN